MGTVTLSEGQFGWDYLLENEDGRDVLIQTDWDYPSIAMMFGWTPCHGETDGTVDCPVCGKQASALITEAQAYLDDHIGCTAEDTGYFDSSE